MSKTAEPGTEPHLPRVWDVDWADSECPLNPTHGPEQIECHDIFGDGMAFVLRNVLTPEECEQLIAMSEAAGYRETGYAQNYRSNLRVIVRCEDISRRLYERVAPHVRSQFHVTADEESKLGYNTEGTWNANGANEVLRFCRYSPQAHFGPHYDSHFQRDEHNRSFLTLMCYLSGRESFAGGCTNFVDDNQSLQAGPDGLFRAPDEAIYHKIDPEPGLALVFFHKILHEGEQVSSCEPGCFKYIMRSEVMFERDVSTVREESPAAIEAAELFRQAEAMEAQGNCSEAARLYSRAFRKDKRLADAYKS